jgi:DNA oxidative demethylase
MTQNRLFFDSTVVELQPNVWLLPTFVPLSVADELLASLRSNDRLRHMSVPGGHYMSVAMTSMGEYGWVTDQQGYRYSSIDPVTNAAWPDMPDLLRELAKSAARACGWDHFDPDSCLINRYEAGAKMGEHRDDTERDFSAPIVSVSLGAVCKFFIGDMKRGETKRDIALQHRDVMVWGGSARLIYHGVRPLKNGTRFNLTFRKAM